MAAQDKRRNNGGHSTKPKRPDDKRLLKKSEKEKTSNIFLKALSEIHNTENDDDTKKAFAKDLLSFSRGKMFIANHLFGVPDKTVDVNVQSKPDLSHLSVDDLRQLMDDSDEE